MKNPESNLPPGFRFHPTDEELILHYLRNKVTSMPLPVSIIAEVDIYKFDPWDLPGLSFPIFFFFQFHPEGLDDKSLQPQKSSSFSNLLDAMDYSMLRSFLSDNPMGFETTPTFNTPVSALHQTSNNNCNDNSYGLFQKLPQLSSSAPNTGDRLKRLFSNRDDDQDTLNSSKKYISSCSFLNSNIQSDVPQNLVNLPFLNQQLLSSLDSQFQG